MDCFFDADLLFLVVITGFGLVLAGHVLFLPRTVSLHVFAPFLAHGLSTGLLWWSKLTRLGILSPLALLTRNTGHFLLTVFLFLDGGAR